MSARRLLLALAFLAAIASQALPADKAAAPKRMPPVVEGDGAAWAVASVLEIVGAAFPTLPEPYVSVQIKTTTALDGAPVGAESRSVNTQRVTMTPAEARALGEALIAWADDPSSTTTLLAKSY